MGGGNEGKRCPVCRDGLVIGSANFDGFECTHCSYVCGPGVRTFTTGATRDTDEGKPRYHDYNCPLVDQAFGEYMLKHQDQSDGSKRDADNWKGGFPYGELVESLLRHVKDLQLHYDGYQGKCREQDINEVFGGIIFNAQAYWSQLLRGMTDENMAKDD